MNRQVYQALTLIACVLVLFGCNTNAPFFSNANKDLISRNEQGACFAADTLVMMADGTAKKIIDIKIGEKVKSFDIKTGRMVDTEVLRTKSGFAGYHYVLNGSLKVTPPHPFRTPNDKWVKIEDLKEGQSIRASNSIRKISSIEEKFESLKIYNIFVKENQNYYVSGDGEAFFLVREWR